MGWADNYIAELRAGRSVSFRPHGSSMRGKIEDGELVLVEPVKLKGLPWAAGAVNVKEGDVVLCKVKGKQFLHLVVSIRDGIHEQFLIGNMRGFTNGWTSARNIYGKVTKVG